MRKDYINYYFLSAAAFSQLLLVSHTCLAKVYFCFSLGAEILNNCNFDLDITNF